MPRIAWFTALGDAKSLKSSSFSRAVLARAPEDWEVELFVDEADLRSLRGARPAQLYDFPVFVHHQAFLRDSAKPFDVFCYQLENDSRCSFIKRAAALWPGVVFCHDAGFSALELHAVAHSTTGAALNDRLKELYGDEAPALGDWQARGWSIDALSSTYLAGARVDGASRIVVTSERAYAELAAKNAGVPISMTAFPVKCVRREAVAADRAGLRQRLGLEQGAPVIAAKAGALVEERHVLILEALAGLHERLGGSQALLGRACVHLVWIAESAEEQSKLEELQQRYAPRLPARAIHIVRAGRSQSAESWLDVADVYIAPKFSAVRGTALETYSALARGIPTVVPRFGAERDLPPSAVMHVSVGSTECRELILVLHELLSKPDFHHSLSQAARRYIEVVCDPGAVVEDLRALFKLDAQRLDRLLSERREDYLSERRRFCNQLRGELEEGGLAERAIRDFSWNQLGRQ